MARPPAHPGKDPASSGGRRLLFWLDLDIHDPGTDDDVSSLLIDTFDFHPVAVQAADQFGQRARIDDYDDLVPSSVSGWPATASELIAIV